MKLTIVLDDNVVIVDGIMYNNLDLSSLDKNIHAVQFDGSLGWIEYKNKPQRPINSITEFQAIIDQHTERYAFDKARELNPYHGMTDTERLEAKRLNKLTELNTAYSQAEDTPYTLGALTYAGGLESTRLLREARDIMLELERPKATTFTIQKEIVELPHTSETEIDINDVVQSLAIRSEANLLKYITLINKLERATTEIQIEAITW